MSVLENMVAASRNHRYLSGNSSIFVGGNPINFVDSFLHLGMLSIQS